MIDFHNAAFISANRAHLSAAENNVRTATLVADLHRYGLKAEPVKGVYQGVAEDSFIVELADSPEGGRLQQVNYVLQLARRYEQESVLLTSNGLAYLAYTDDRITQGIGSMFWVAAQCKPNWHPEGDYTRLSDGSFLVVE